MTEYRIITDGLKYRPQMRRNFVLRWFTLSPADIGIIRPGFDREEYEFDDLESAREIIEKAHEHESGLPRGWRVTREYDSAWLALQAATECSKCVTG